ncbi:MAG: hypothetical protein NVS3B16_09920 [Vulcanimicrobiaceae bacterium]
MKPHVVILGGGFAGLATARALERRRDVSVTLVARENYSLFTPMLPEVASGAIEPRHIAEPLRVALRSSTFELGEVTGIDFERKLVHVGETATRGGRQVSYDALAIALGATTSTHHIPGADDHTYPLKTLEDATRLRRAIVGMLEFAAPSKDRDERREALTFVVVGGGFTGVEAVGELRGYVRRILRYYPGIARDDVRVVLVAGSSDLLQQLPARFGKRAANMLAARGVEVVLDDQVASVDGGGLTLKSGKRYASRTVVWSAGVRPAALVETLDVPKSEHGAIAVGSDFAVPQRDNVWALGDCAAIPKPGGGSYPQTAQDAVREGPLLARNIVSALHGRNQRAFRYKSPGMMASLGAREGLAELGPGIMIAGFPAWVLWRGYYLSQLSGLDRKARVALDWTLNLPFPGDIAST